jgi:hypothetical protein
VVQITARSVISKNQPQERFNAPVYRFSSRKDNNLVCQIVLASDEPVEHWVMRGAALYLIYTPPV